MKFKGARDVYWKYYISLEEQFMDTKRYVEFDYINNGRSYSMEYLKLFQAVCSEVDVVGKVLAAQIDPSFKATKTTGINEWWYFVSRGGASLLSRKCKLLEEHDIEPWKGFAVKINPIPGAKKYILDDTLSPKAKTPEWWNSYNKRNDVFLLLASELGTVHIIVDDAFFFIWNNSEGK